MAQTVLRGKAELADLGDVELDFAVEVGRTVLPMDHLMQMKKGDVIALGKLAGEAYEVRLNDHLFAQGETVVVTDMLCVRLTRMEDPPEAKEGA
ncbi:FliM/FliN family flagellar motor switch protein [Candidatus Latescibacterota bacterium]